MVEAVSAAVLQPLFHSPFYLACKRWGRKFGWLLNFFQSQDREEINLTQGLPEGWTMQVAPNGRVSFFFGQGAFFKSSGKYIPYFRE